MAVAGVLAEADVGDKDELFGGFGLLKGVEAPLDDTVLVPGAGGLLVLGFGQAEEEQSTKAEGGGLLGFAHCLVDGEVEDAGHGADFMADALAGAEKEGVDQVAGLKGGFAHQGAQRLSAAEAAHAGFRKTHSANCR